MLEILALRDADAELAADLGRLFESLRAAGDEATFHPHPLTNEEADRLAAYEGLDEYYVLVERPRVLGYAMLRGWDEGYQVPSAGIAVHPQERGSGLGKMLMKFLEAAARRRGATRLRLTVSPQNAVAIGLYRSLGYEFKPCENGSLEGILSL